MKKFGFPRVFAQLARHSIVKPFLLVTICWQDGLFYAIVRCCFRKMITCLPLCMKYFTIQFRIYNLS